MNGKLTKAQIARLQIIAAYVPQIRFPTALNGGRTDLVLGDKGLIERAYVQDGPYTWYLCRLTPAGLAALGKPQP